MTPVGIEYGKGVSHGKLKGGILAYLVRQKKKKVEKLQSRWLATGIESRTSRLRSQLSGLN